MTKDELKKEFEKYLKDSSDYYDPREPLTERKLLQMWLDCAEPREKQIAELEKENAELKGSLELYESGCCRAEKECAIKDQLAQAKEILQLFLKLKITPCASGNSINMFQFESVCEQAEQFIKEIEK